MEKTDVGNHGPVMVALHDDIPSPDCCPYCGALNETQGRTALLDKLTLQEGIWALADTAERFGPAVIAVLLLRTRYPHESGRKIARRLGLSAAGTFRAYLRAYRENPRLAAIMRGCGTKTRGLAGGRKPGGKQ